MFDLALNDAQVRLGTNLQSFAIEKLRGFAAESEISRDIPTGFVDALASFSELPGRDAFASGTDDPLSLVIAAEKLAWADPALALAWLTSRQVAWLIASCGTDEQKSAYLPRLAQSPLTEASLLLFEGYGRSPSEFETRATRVGSEWIVDGDKTAVVFAGKTQIGIVVARDDDGDLVAFVLDGHEGVESEGIDDRRVSMGAISFATTAKIRGLKVGPDAALNSEGLTAALAVCRLAQAAISLGSSEATTRYAADWGLNRIAFGRPLVGFQGVSFVLADLFMEVETVRLQIWEALATAVHGLPGIESSTSRAVARANTLYRNAAREGIELMGVHGVISDHPAERVYRSAAVMAGIDFDPLLNPLVLSR